MENPLPSVYVETSIVSYLSARESSSLLGAAHQLVTRGWWDRRNLYCCFVSDVVIRECRAGDPTAALRRLNAGQLKRRLKGPGSIFLKVGTGETAKAEQQTTVFKV